MMWSKLLVEKKTLLLELKFCDLIFIFKQNNALNSLFEYHPEKSSYLSITKPEFIIIKIKTI